MKMRRLTKYLVVLFLLTCTGGAAYMLYSQHIHVTKRLVADIYSEPVQMVNTYGIQLVTLGASPECNEAMRSTLRVLRDDTNGDEAYVCLRTKTGTYTWSKVTNQQS